MFTIPADGTTLESIEHNTNRGSDARKGLPRIKDRWKSGNCHLFHSFTRGSVRRRRANNGTHGIPGVLSVGFLRFLRF